MNAYTWSEALATLLTRFEGEARTALVVPAGVDRIARLFALSQFERDILILGGAFELDSRAATAYRSKPEGFGSHPTIGLALGLLDDGHLSAFAPTAPLRSHRLIEISPGPLPTAQFRIDERILFATLDVETIDIRLTSLVRRVEPDAVRPDADQLDSWWADASDGAPLIHVHSPDAAVRRQVASAAWARRGGRLWFLRAADLASLQDRETVSMLCDRERVLSDAGFAIEIAEDDPPEVLRTATAFVERTRSVCAVLARAPTQLPLASRTIEVPGELPRAQRAAQSRQRLDDLAQRIEPIATWNDLVLPKSTLDVLRTIASQVAHRAQVYETWGFGGTNARGLGITAMFAGTSGTGKTLAAEIIAAHLGLDLYRVDLSQVVSKYIGETEKNLRRVFDAADEGTVVLLFDEADALFGKRSEVKDSHDRHANIEVSYLLQRMETYRGLAILTTNARDALDQSFLRRLRFVVEFPFPDVLERIELWRRVFPTATPTEGLDAHQLARMRITGGNVRTIALNAAFIAASRGEPVGHAHVMEAAALEFRKLGKPQAELQSLNL